MEAAEVLETESTIVDVPVLRRAAMDFLARREHSFFELAEKLSMRFPDEELMRIESVLEDLAAENLQSDARFVEAWSRYRKSRGFGYHHIRQDLLQRRVSGELIDQHLFTDDECWQQMASMLVRRRTLNSSKFEFGSAQHRRLVRFLESRGFGSREIQLAIAPHLLP
jgi:regulatory protein